MRTHWNLWDVAKAMFREKSVGLNPFIRNEEKGKIIFLSLNIKLLRFLKKTWNAQTHLSLYHIKQKTVT